MSERIPAQTTDACTSSKVDAILFLTALLIPCGLSAAFAMRDPAAPPVAVPADRPALVFASYLYSTGTEPLEDQPLISEVFPFINQSDRDVRITGLEASCGCLSPSITSREIAPGEAGRVTLPIRTANETPGQHEYLVTVRYEDPRPRQVTLTWQVVLPEKKIRVEPKVLMVMGSVSAEHSYDIMVSDHRTFRRDSPLRIGDVAVSSPLMTATNEGLSSTGVVPATRISVRFQPPIPDGQHRGLVSLKTDDPLFPYLQVPVIVKGRPRPEGQEATAEPDNAVVVVTPDDPAGCTGTTVTFEIPAAWQVSHCDIFPPQLVAGISSGPSVSPESGRVSVTISFTGLPDAGVERGVLTLNAKNGDQPEMVTVPLSLVWKR